MKRTWILVLTLVLALAASACGGSPGTGGAGSGETPAADEPGAESAPAPGVPAPPEAGADGEDDPEEHSHLPSGEGNVVEHEAAGYCGNTVTTVSRDTRMGGEPWEASFWGDDSVALTDLLRYLDYSEDVCRCLPEYTVDTEFGTGYGVNLTEGYVRYNDSQVTLTEEQTAQIREIIDRQMSDGE